MGDRSGRYPRDRDRRGRDDDRRTHDDRRAPNDMPRFTGRDDSRVNHEFLFEHSRQPPADSYRPGNSDQRPSQAPPSGPRRGGRNGASRGRGGGRNYGRVGRDGRPFVFQAPVPAHERPILYFDIREKTPELMAGMVPGNGDRFKEGVEEVEEVEVEEVEEVEGEGGEGEGVGEEGEGGADTPMEMSGDEAGIEDEKVQMDKAEEKPEKKTDVISMIRAFKKQTTSTRNAVAENDDFIPFSLGDEEGAKQQSEPELESEPEWEAGRKMRRTNDGHRIVDHGHYRNRNESDPKSSSTGGFSHRDAHYSRVNDKKPTQDVGPPGAPTAAPARLPPPPGLGESIKFKIGEDVKRITADLPPKPAKSFDGKGGDMPWPPPPPPKDLPLPPPPPGGFSLIDIPKKRKFDDMSEKKRGGPLPPDGNVKADWVIRPGSGVDPTPWVREGGDHSRCLEITDWLHKEITDFITYIQPCAYEHAIRRELIHRVRQAITNLWPDTDVRVFGSFAAELYLPTSDVDLVVLSKSYAEFDIPKYASQKSLRMVANALKKAGIANYGDIQVISKAKVPIVKFVDSITNINVDISFENGSGLVANETFQRWKVAYPAMPILVVLIKHFLSMRGLNEVYHGGLGSFSVTCLVVSMLQLLPSVRSGAIDPRLHLGVMLLEFLELYGRNLNTTIVGIRVDENSPGYFRKAGVFALNANVKPWQLSIQDPNNPDNDISKSSYMISLILQCFSDAHDALLRQMELLDRLPFEQRVGRSILGVILGGNYMNIAKVRDRLKYTYQSRFGSPDGDELKVEKEESKEAAVAARKRDMEAPKGAPKGPRAQVGEGAGRDHKKRRGPPRVATESVVGGDDGKREVIIID